MKDRKSRIIVLINGRFSWNNSKSKMIEPLKLLGSGQDHESVSIAMMNDASR